MGNIVRNGVDYSNSDLIDSLPDYLADRGEGIPDGSDLNDYITPGKYYCSSGTNAATLENFPDTSTAGFSLYVLRNSYSDFMQIMLLNGSSRTQLIFVRFRTSSGGGGSWYSVF